MMIKTGLLVALMSLFSCLSACRTGEWIADPSSADFRPSLLDRSEKNLGNEAAYAYYAAAELLYESGDLEGALDAFDEALVADNADVYLMTRLATLLIEMDTLSRAENLLEKALRADPANSDAWLTLARYHAAKGSDDKAEAAARQAIRAAPGEVDARLWLAEEKQRQGDVAFAVALLTQASEANSRSAAVYLALGRSLVVVGRYADACRYLGIAVRLQPGRSGVVAELARAALAAGGRAGAADLMELALERDPTDETLRLEVIDLLFDLGQPARAERHILSLPALEGDDRDRTIERAALYVKASLYYEARDIVRHQLDHHPRDAALRLALSGIEIRLGRLEAAALLLGDPDVTWSAEAARCREVMASAIRRWPESVPLCDLSGGRSEGDGPGTIGTR